jgi:hypothetical protein
MVGCFDLHLGSTSWVKFCQVRTDDKEQQDHGAETRRLTTGGYYIRHNTWLRAFLDGLSSTYLDGRGQARPLDAKVNERLI